jgi:hypothetical protein
MNAILKCADLSRDELLDLLGLVPVGTDDVRLWLEGIDGWALAYWPGVVGEVPWCGAGREPETHRLAELIPASVSGRIFAPSGELRWRVVPALGERCCRTVFLGERDWLPGRLQDRCAVLAELEAVQSKVILWGQKTEASDGEWIELRIPHRFRYPVRDLESFPGGRVGVKALVEEWRDVRGETHFMRLRDLQANQER